MPSETPAASTDGADCYRCCGALAADEGASLSVMHRNAAVTIYRDLEKRVCADCLAAMGLLDVPDRVRNRAAESDSAGRGNGSITVCQ